MKVWLVYRHFPHEDTEILSVHSTEYGAKRTADLLADSPNNYVEYGVEEHEVVQ